MGTIRRICLSIALGLLLPLVPVAASAGGSAGGGVPPGRGGGGAFRAALSINVDHTTVQGTNVDFLDYYPHAAVVHVGDTVDFHFVESNGNTFHTVTFVPIGTQFTDQALTRLFPGAGTPQPDKDDGPGPPIFDFSTGVRPCGNSPYYPGTAPCIYDGKSVVNSSPLFANSEVETGKFHPTPPLHFSVTMNVAPGTYRFFCLVHGPAMGGVIHVVAAGAPTTTAAQAAAASDAQFQKQLALINHTTASLPAPGQQVTAGHTTWSINAGADTPPTSGVEYDEYSAKTLDIKVGDTVTWSPKGLHTVQFPRFSGVSAIGFACEQAGQDRPLGASLAGCTLEIPLGRGALPSGPSGQPYSGGVAGSGILLVPSPHTWSMSFPTAGTYRYQCLVHWGMYGTINVH